jgi:cytosolic carboxypeptidase protein 2/3
MNPTLKEQQEPLFDSNFESGNLDAVIRVGFSEYDLFMRVDSNTRGHVQWFNFTICSKGFKKVKINIVNFRKYRTLYSQSLRPYVFSSANPKNGWKQGCINVKYDKKLLRYDFLADRFSA